MVSLYIPVMFCIWICVSISWYKHFHFLLVIIQRFISPYTRFKDRLGLSFKVYDFSLMGVIRYHTSLELSKVSLYNFRNKISVNNWTVGANLETGTIATVFSQFEIDNFLSSFVRDCNIVLWLTQWMCELTPRSQKAHLNYLMVGLFWGHSVSSQ